MTNLTIDNTATNDLKKVVTWQFDKAENLVAVIGILRDFFIASVSDMWDEVSSIAEIADSADDFTLAVWGKILGVRRPEITVGGSDRTLSTEAYRRILVARFKLLDSCGSVDDYIDFIKYIFGNAVSISYENGMALSFQYDNSQIPEDTESMAYELYALLAQHPDTILLYPSGVENNNQSSGPIVIFEEQVGAVCTSVTVTVYGDEGSVVHSGSSFTYNGTSYSSSSDASIGSDGKIDILFKATGTHIIPACETFQISDSTDTYTGSNWKRSVIDFTGETLDNATIAWER